MDPLNQVDVMHLQRSRSSVLDLSVGCRQRPLKTNSTEALDLVKKSSWCGITSGCNNKSINLSESRSDRYITCNPNAPDHPEPASQRHGSMASSPDIYSLPLTDIDGQQYMYPPTDCVFADDDCRVETDRVLTQAKALCRKADSILENGTVGDRIQHNGLETHTQETLSSYGESYLNDTLSQTKGSSRLSQDTNAAAYTLRSSRSAVEHTPVETLKSECTAAKELSTCSIEIISSDDDSDIIEVPITNYKCKTPPNCRSQFRDVKVEINHGNQRTASARQKDACNRQMGCSPKNVNNEPDRPKFKMASESRSLLSWMESVMIPIIPQDSDQDMDSAFSKLLPSTSNAENTSILKSPPIGSSSSTSRQPRKSSASKSRKRSKPRPKQKKPRKRLRVSSAANTPKKTRRKPCSSRPTSMFSPQEPEIKLKYVNHKEDKRDAKVDGFAPYIHMEFSSCTVVNFRKEDDFATKKEQQQPVSGVIPSTSCLQLGRVSSDDRFQVRHFCCLCGRAANEEGLGDLHGPYHPSGVQPICKDNTSPFGRRRDPEYSDIDSVYSLEDGVPQLIKQTGHLLVSPKRQKKENSVEKVEDSGAYSGRWIHEDCSIWTSAVFLVKGKLYGLEEAIRLAQGMVCSHCHRAGATLGCFFKDCPNKYHFPCTLKSDGALCEENFTIRCPKHKNKSSRLSVSRLKNR